MHRARCNPIIYFGWTAEALPCAWRDLRFLTDHMLLDAIIDKYVHAFHYFSPSVLTMSTTGATNMIFFRLHVAVMVRPELRPDSVTPQKVYSRHSNGLEPFGGVHLVYVDVAYGSVRNTLDTLNRVVPNLGVEGATAKPTPIRSFATSPMERRVTLIIEFPRETPPTFGSFWRICGWNSTNRLSGK